MCKATEAKISSRVIASSSKETELNTKIRAHVSQTVGTFQKRHKYGILFPCFKESMNLK